MLRGFVWVWMVAVSGWVGAQAPSATGSGAGAGVGIGSQAIDRYIATGWDRLGRSMTDCASLVDTKLADTKLTGGPVLYLPAEEKVPAAVEAMEARCKVRVEHLPRVIHKPGDLMPEQIAVPGLLYLPNRYVVPGGRFNEMYGWDSYFIILGLLESGRVDLARGMVENFFYEIEHYGSVLNANRTYFLTRSQPPFLSSMVLAVYEAERKSAPGEARKFLETARPYLVRDHDLWTRAPHLAGTTGLSRYFDLGHGPVPEMNDDSRYYVDVIRWLVAHPDQVKAESGSGYLVKAPAGGAGAGAGAGTGAGTDVGRDCAKSGSAVCLQTEADGYRLSPEFYVGDRAMRESGFDVSFRFGPFSGSTEDYAPVCLNALLYKYERDLAWIEGELGGAGAGSGSGSGAAGWKGMAEARRATMDRLMWDEGSGLYFDYDVRRGERSKYAYLTAFYPLWAGAASKEQAAKMMVAALPRFEHAGGLAMSATVSGMQWDAPYGWAPVNWIVDAGLARYGYTVEADQVAREFMRSVRENFEHDGTIREKYNVEDANADVKVAAGYKANVIGFWWTNGVYLEMEDLLRRDGGATGTGRGAGIPTPP